MAITLADQLSGANGPLVECRWRHQLDRLFSIDTRLRRHVATAAVCVFEDVRDAKPYERKTFYTNIPVNDLTSMLSKPTEMETRRVRLLLRPAGPPRNAQDDHGAFGRAAWRRKEMR